MNDYANGNGEAVEIMPAQPNDLTALVRGEVDAQVATAKNWPRKIKRSLDTIRSLALMSPKTAEGCFYTLKRGGNVIEGPSIRLAEIVASSWGNMRVEGRMLEPERKRVRAQAVAWDLETNVAFKIEVTRRITNAQGHRYNDDMINTTQSAALSIAVRNAVFKVIPRAMIDEILDEAKKVALGDAKSIADRRTQAIRWFGSLGVREEQILAYLEVDSVLDIGADELSRLLGEANRIKDGVCEVEDVFPELRPEDDPPKNGGEKKPATNGKTNGSKASSVADRIRNQGKTEEPPAQVDDDENEVEPVNPERAPTTPEAPPEDVDVFVTIGQMIQAEDYAEISGDRLAELMEAEGVSARIRSKDKVEAFRSVLDEELRRIREAREEAEATDGESEKATEYQIGQVFQAIENRYGQDSEADILATCKTILGFPDNLETIDDLTSEQVETILAKVRVERDGQTRLT